MFMTIHLETGIFEESPPSYEQCCNPIIRETAIDHIGIQSDTTVNIDRSLCITPPNYDGLYICRDDNLHLTRIIRDISILNHNNDIAPITLQLIRQYEIPQSSFYMETSYKKTLVNIINSLCFITYLIYDLVIIYLFSNSCISLNSYVYIHMTFGIILFFSYKYNLPFGSKIPKVISLFLFTAPIMYHLSEFNK